MTELQKHAAIRPALDLEPVQKLLRALEPFGSHPSREEVEEWDREVARYAYEARGGIRSLLINAHEEPYDKFVKTLQNNEQKRLLEEKFAVDLEPVQRMIADIEGGLIGAQGACAALRAIPELIGPLLAEVERLREENARMQRAITKAAEEGLSHAD